MIISREAWFVGGVAFTLGLLALVAAIHNRDWYYQLPKIQWVEERFGRPAARCIYAVLGAMLIVLALFVWRCG